MKAEEEVTLENEKTRAHMAEIVSRTLSDTCALEYKGEGDDATENIREMLQNVNYLAKHLIAPSSEDKPGNRIPSYGMKDQVFTELEFGDLHAANVRF